MYITNFQHFLNEEGNIPTDMPKEARELANFLALLIDDASTGDYDAKPTIRWIDVVKGAIHFLFDGVYIIHHFFNVQLFKFLSFHFRICNN